MDIKRPKLFGGRSKIKPSNSEFDFDDLKDNDEPVGAPVPSLFWSERFKKKQAQEPSVHNSCPRDSRKRKLPLKDNMNKLSKINHLDEICNRAARAKIIKNKGKIGTNKSNAARTAFDFDETPNIDRVKLSPSNPSKRPLKAESPVKHRKVVSSSFDFPTEEKEKEIKEKTQNIFKPGPKKAKLNMKTLRSNKSNGRLCGIFDIPKDEENCMPMSDDAVIEIEHIDIDRPEEPKTMVSNVKDSGNCIKDGVNQTFFDEFDYLFDGIKKTEPMAVRTLSTFNVTKNCFTKDFRHNIRKNNFLKTIFKELSDADEDPSLALCTSAFFYVIAIDDRHFDFSKDAIETILKILKAEECNISKKATFPEKKPTKSLTNFRKKIGDLFRTELKTVEFIDLDNISTADLVHEVLIFLTAPTAEVDFREFIRTMGGIDFFLLSFEFLLSRLDKYHRITNENCKRFVKIERCLQMIENLTYMNSDNQNYAVNFKTKVIVKSLYGTLTNCLSVIHKNRSSKIKLLGKSKNLDSVFDCLYSTMRMMLNLTHGNEYSCTEIGKCEGMISCVMETVLFLPANANMKHKLDCYTLGLGVLNNLLGEVSDNRKILAKCKFDTSPWFDPVEDSIEERNKKPVELLVQTFLKFHERSAELEKQTFSEAESLCLEEQEEGGQPTEVNLEIEEPGLEKRDSNSASAAAKTDKDKDSNGDDPFGYDESDKDFKKPEPKAEKNDEKNSEKVQKVVDKMIVKAGEHMEESMICSYLALLIGLLTKDEDNLELVRELMPEPKVLIEVLRKFLQFMNMMSLTSAAASKSGMQQIRSIVHWLNAVL